MKKGEKVSGLYLCQFSQGTLKVGMGVDIGARLVAHRSAGAVFGISVSRTDVVPCDNPRRAEKLLLEWCVANSTTQTSHEWFVGVDYESCLAAAHSAASAMMGPHPWRPPKGDPIEALAAHFKLGRTKEGDLYREVRGMMVRNQISGDVVAALDYLHHESEKVRAALRVGASMPEWYDLLNSFEPWEVELWFNAGNPSSDLLSAASRAILTIAEFAEGKEVANA